MDGCDVDSCVGGADDGYSKWTVVTWIVVCVCVGGGGV